MQIQERIIILRGQQVLLDRDLAELYGIETRIPKQAVRRNSDRFPEDFMFIVTETELQTMVSQFVIPTLQHAGWWKPFAFTEHGILMLANVLRSSQALAVSIQIIRYFIAMRKLVELKGAVQEELSKIHDHLSEHDELIEQLCFEMAKINHEAEQPKRTIWFRTNTEK